MPETAALGARQRAAIAFIVEHPRAKQADVAEAVGVSDRTLRSWQLQPRYVAALDDATAASEATARGTARRLHGRVVGELAALAFDDPSPTVRLRACDSLLRHLHEYDLDGVLERLDALEQQQQLQHQRGAA